MDGTLLNAQQLREQLTNRLNDLQSSIQSPDFGKPELTLLLEAMLEERHLIMEEYDYQLNRRSQTYYVDNSFQLMIPSMDPEQFNSLSLLASRLELSVGTLLSVFMELFNEHFTDDQPILTANMLSDKLKRRNSIRISHYPKVVIREQDLLELSDEGLWVKLSHIGTLEFDQVPYELFAKTVDTISHCTTVTLPADYPKYLVYYKSFFCKQLEFRN